MKKIIQNSTKMLKGEIKISSNNVPKYYACSNYGNNILEIYDIHTSQIIYKKIGAVSEFNNISIDNECVIYSYGKTINVINFLSNYSEIYSINNFTGIENMFLFKDKLFVIFIDNQEDTYKNIIGYFSIIDNKINFEEFHQLFKNNHFYKYSSNDIFLKTQDNIILIRNGNNFIGYDNKQDDTFTVSIDIPYEYDFSNMFFANNKIYSFSEYFFKLVELKLIKKKKNYTLKLDKILYNSYNKLCYEAHNEEEIIYADKTNSSKKLYSYNLKSKKLSLLKDNMLVNLLTNNIDKQNHSLWLFHSNHMKAYVISNKIFRLL